MRKKRVQRERLGVDMGSAYKEAAEEMHNTPREWAVGAGLQTEENTFWWGTQDVQRLAVADELMKRPQKEASLEN